MSPRSAGRAGGRPGTILERVLRALAEGGAMGRSRVAKAIGVSPKSVEAPLRNLFRAGRVTRTGTSAQTVYAAKK